MQAGGYIQTRPLNGERTFRVLFRLFSFVLVFSWRSRAAGRRRTRGPCGFDVAGRGRPASRQARGRPGPAGSAGRPPALQAGGYSSACRSLAHTTLDGARPLMARGILVIVFYSCCFHPRLFLGKPGEDAPEVPTVSTGPGWIGLQAGRPGPGRGWPGPVGRAGPAGRRVGRPAARPASRRLH